MSAVQNPPVTVITVPPETTTTTTAPTTTTTPASATSVTEAPTTTVATSVATTEAPASPVDVGQPEEGLVLVVFLGLAALVALVFLLVREFRSRKSRPTPVAVPAGSTVADRVRAAAAKAQLEGPGEDDPLPDVSVADLYPWLESPEDLTLVVDLRTAEALQGVGVTSLTQLAAIDDEMVKAMVAAGIDIDTRAVEAAAQDILGRRAKGEID